MWELAARMSKTAGDAAIVKVDTATIATDLETQRCFSITACGSGRCGVRLNSATRAYRAFNRHRSHFLLERGA